MDYLNAEENFHKKVGFILVAYAFYIRGLKFPGFMNLGWDLFLYGFTHNDN
jgi:hypothetical protein